MYIVICEHNVPLSFIDFMHSNTCFQLFKYIFVKTWIYTQIFKLVKTWKIGKTWISPPKFQNPEKTVKMRNYTPQCWTRIGTTGLTFMAYYDRLSNVDLFSTLPTVFTNYIPVTGHVAANRGWPDCAASWPFATLEILWPVSASLYDRPETPLQNTHCLKMLTKLRIPSGTKGFRGMYETAKFPILRDKSRFFTFSATDREISHSLRQIAIFSVLREKSRIFL